MFEGFKRIHFLAYTFFFFGKIMSLVAACCIFSNSPYLYLAAALYVALIAASFICGMYDQSNTTGGFGFAEYFGLTYKPKT
tara:strand:+ start:1944 stop:2186 length:243 start_codon:yes stop_codon:yes gene_type:complete